MSDDEIRLLCAKLRAMAEGVPTSDIDDILEVFAIVVADLAHAWPKAAGVTSAEILDVFHARATLYAARAARAAHCAGR